MADITVEGDAGLLRQAVTNLLTNAVQYTPSGGITVTVHRDRPTDLAVVRVTDTGPGIDALDRERVFERFVRLDAARSSPQGSGLGLPIARWIAEQHGGTLTLEPVHPHGCSFVLSLPVGRRPNANLNECR
jgi:signal transduction histidine kinase